MSAPPPRELALLFPGQGVGDASVRDVAVAERPDLLDLACELAGDDPFSRMDEGTRFAQPAIYCASLAAFERLGRPEADLLAGHSLGEITALVAGGALGEGDGLRVVVERGRLMAAAAAGAEPGGMLAVGAPRREAVELAERHSLTVANENSPCQFVLSGPERLLLAAERDARSSGLRTKRLAVRGAFHSPAMEPAVEAFGELLGAVDFRRPRVPVLSCVTANRFGADVRGLLAVALTRPVRWVEVLRRLHLEGAGRFTDVGPGRVLAGLVRRTLDGVAVETNPLPAAQGA